MIFVAKKVPQPFTVKQIELVTTFADQALIAIENTRLLNALRQRTDDLGEALEQQTATSEVLQVISRSPGDLGPVFEAMLANAMRLCEAKFGTINLHDERLDSEWSRNTMCRPHSRQPGCAKARSVPTRPPIMPMWFGPSRSSTLMISPPRRRTVKAIRR